jgi:membrane fusion protein, multidrug efflux system
MTYRKRTIHFLAKNLLTALFLSFFLIFLNGCKGKQDPSEDSKTVRPVKLFKLGGATLANTQKIPGVVRASERVDLAFQVPGPIANLPVKEGQKINKGDLIARINPRDYETNLRNAKGALAKAKARLAYDIAEYHRYVSVKQKEPGAVSDSSVSLKLAAQNIAKADLQSAEAAVDEVRDKLEYTNLRAPFSGMIAKKFVDNYQEVQAKQAIVSLQNTSDIEVLVDLPESTVAPLRKVKPAIYAEFASVPDKHFDLAVKEFATQADSATQTYKVVFVMHAPSGVRILPGMTANVVIDFSEVQITDPEISIPAIALFADNDGHSCVWQIDPKSMAVRRQIVTTGELRGSDSIRIISGLNLGDTIAISGVSKLREGQIVRAFE